MSDVASIRYATPANAYVQGLNADGLAICAFPVGSDEATALIAAFGAPAPAPDGALPLTLEERIARLEAAVFTP